MNDAPSPSEHERLQAELERQRRLAAATHALHSSLELREVLRHILDAAREGVDAERGTVFLFTEDKNELWSEVVTGEERVEIRLALGKGIAGHVAATGETIRTADAYAHPRFDPSWDRESGFETRQILCAPVRNREGEVVGCFQLLNKRAGEFDAQDEEFLAGLSVPAALAVENARLHAQALEQERQTHEIDMALSVQRQIQPERRTLVQGSLAAAGLNELCEDASGDYYDLIPLPNRRLCVTVGDVSGHGLQAALLMTTARALLRSLAPLTVGTVGTEGIARTVDRVNDHLVPDLETGKFLSLFAASIHSGTGEVDWCNAGHCPPLHFRAETGELRELRGTGLVLGVMDGLGYEAGEPFVLAPGDSLLIFTDGVTEARRPDGEMLGDERLQALFAEHAGESPTAILAAVRAGVLEWTEGAPNDDDLTLLAVRRLPEA